LFAGAACIVTDNGEVEEERLARVEEFWRLLDCRVWRMGPAAHDALVARVSHLPHLVAAGLVQVALREYGHGGLGGGGLRDTTRVAGGNAGMWAEILTENREALLGPLRETIADLSEILARLESGDQEAARQWLAAAKQQRDTLNSIC
jgi:prephenate dehydrogenase